MDFFPVVENLFSTGSEAHTFLTEFSKLAICVCSLGPLQSKSLGKRHDSFLTESKIRTLCSQSWTF